MKWLAVEPPKSIQKNESGIKQRQSNFQKIEKQTKNGWNENPEVCAWNSDFAV